MKQKCFMTGGDCQSDCALYREEECAFARLHDVADMLAAIAETFGTYSDDMTKAVKDIKGNL